MSNETAVTQTTNIVPVQGIFKPEPTYELITFIGPAGTPFLPQVDPNLDGVTITNSTINSSIIGGSVPAAAFFTNVSTTTGQVATLPSASTDIANKQYVDSVAQGLDIKAACLYTTTGNITLSGLTTQAGGDWGSTLTAGSRVLVKNQAAPAENGIYAASATGWTRTADMNVWSEVPSAFTFIQQGVTLADTGWVCTADPGGTIDVTAMPWTQFSGAGTYLAGNGLQIVGNTFSVKPNGTSLDASSSGLKISDTYAGQTSITTLGTIGTGTWQGSTIGVNYGGTGAATFSAGYVKANGTTPFTTVATIPNTDITGLGTMSTQNANNVAITGGSAALGTLKTLGLTGYLYGNDTNAVTASTTIPNTAITGLGTMSTQNANAVAITGGTATGLTNLGADYLQLNVAAGATYAYGKLYWSSTGTLNVGLDGSASLVMPVGEVLYTYGKASSNITIGQVVIKTGVVGASGVIEFGPSTAGITDGNAIVGIACESIASGSFGRVVNHGVVRGFNLSAYNNNDTLWYDPAGGGAFTATKPSAPNLKAEVGIVINNGSGGSGSMFVSLFPGSQLGGTDQNVQITGTPSNGSLLQYDSALQYWKNVASSTVSVGTASNLAGGGAGYIPYQSGAGATSFLGVGTTGQVLTSNGSSAPTWTTPTAYATVTDDTTTNSTRYPLFANQTTGNLTTNYVSSTKYQFNPSTGELSATGFTGSGANLTNLPAGQLSGTIPSTVLGNSTVYIGTTAILLNRSSASQSLTGVNIDGSAGSATTATTATNATNIAITDNTSSASTWYPILSANSSGNNPATTSSTKISFVPSTGVLSATAYAGTWNGNAVGIAYGGTGLTSTPSNGQIDIGNGTGFTRTTLTAGSNISITNGAGSITIASTGGGSGISWQSVQTSNFTATAGNAYPVNTTSGAVTVTLPASPTAGQFVTILDYAGTAETNNIVINANGLKIQGLTKNAAILTNRQSLNFVYVDSTQGWLSYAQQYATITFQPYSASYLIVAGGGAGGGGINNTSNGGGGGAGGLLSGTATLIGGTTYSFVVGSGGTGVSQSPGSSGSNSTAFSLTAIGGGFGGGGSVATAGGNGGSGGGGNVTGSGGLGSAGAGTSGQGNAGGTGSSPGSYPSGSGGGASAVGGSAGGAGGAGTASSITGSSVTYAGGGGAATNATTSIAGGAGGGGAGGNGTSAGTLNGTAGTANTGGGGGGGSTAGLGNSTGGNGGSGVVIISVPTANYTGITTGSPTVTTSGSNTIMKFTSSGSYTA